MPLLAVLLSLALGVRAQDAIVGALKKTGADAGQLANGLTKDWEDEGLSGVHRLNAPGWSLLDVEGTPLFPLVWLPTLARVVVLPGKTPPGLVAAVTWREGALREGYLPVKALAPDRTAALDLGAEEIALFFEEARYTLSLAAEMDRRFEGDYTAFRERLTTRYFCLAMAPGVLATRWAEFKKAVREDFAVDAADKVAAQEKLKDLVFSVHDPPAGKATLKDGTMLVGVSHSWFRSTPKLAAYYDGGFAARVGDRRLAGDSGEGLTGPGLQTYKDALLELKTFAAGLKDPALSKTPEYLWLQGLTEEKLKGVERLIFIHDETWGMIGSGALWASGIPVDQSFAGLKSHHLLSVLIHEINSNASLPGLLPEDTHLSKEDSVALWETVAGEGLGALKDARKQRAFFQLNPFLGTIYLGYYADKLAQYVPDCR